MEPSFIFFALEEGVNVNCSFCRSSYKEGTADELWHQKGWCQKNLSLSEQEKVRGLLAHLLKGQEIGALQRRDQVPAQSWQKKGGNGRKR